MTVGSSDNQLAFPLSNTGFLNELRIVLMTLLAIEGPLSESRE